MKVLVLTVCIFVSKVIGHGRLDTPLNRGSMWRRYDDLEHNYDDNANFCGGYGVQHERNHHRCGLCGDGFNQPVPRDNELGGRYGQGILAETYHQGQVIDARVDLSANHLGYFTYSICNLDAAVVESEECFDEYPVALANGTSRWMVHEDQLHMLSMKLKLPDDLSCNHCVLRWQYRTGNFAGICKDGSEHLGCGDQENYRTCSDIKIIKN